MSESRQTIGRRVLLAELAAGTLYGFFVVAYAWDAPPAVRSAAGILGGTIFRLVFFAAILGLFNLAMLQGKSGHRARGLVLLVGAVLLLPILLLISFPQY